MLNNNDKLAIFGQIGPNKATFMSQLDLMVIYLSFYGRPNLTPSIGFIEFEIYYPTRLLKSVHNQSIVLVFCINLAIFFHTFFSDDFLG